MDDLTALRRARDLISDPARWTQGEFARDVEGVGVAPNSDKATCWCALGALRRVTRSFNVPWRLIGGISQNHLYITDFNDGHTHVDVLAAFDAAIARESAR